MKTLISQTQSALASAFATAYSGSGVASSSLKVTLEIPGDPTVVLSGVYMSGAGLFGIEYPSKQKIFVGVTGSLYLTDEPIV